ncbi:MAG: hypothetical protein KJ646_05650 [Nanoarchaeota archaeon]|nr:hypothetical protein [Nanoarchaeota archaeon]
MNNLKVTSKKKRLKITGEILQIRAHPIGRNTSKKGIKNLQDRQEIN